MCFCVNSMSLLRLIDANANRAREALRVLEDYARFVLDDDGLCAGLKKLRHTIAAALGGVLAEAVLHRDTPGDVGTGVKTGSELEREDLGHVVTAAGKRLGEALRSLEEYLKVDHVEASRAIERCRYEAYELERRIALTLRPAHARLAAARLYVLITASACRGDWLATAKAAAAGGAQVMQLREKELEAGELLRRAREFVKLCRDHGVVSIINDRPDVAVLSGADGLHVGQGDLPAAEARKLVGVGGRMLLGVSTHEIAHARQARLDGADYLGAGPTYRSPTKPREISPGLPYLSEVAGLEQSGLPVFAIAGITEARVPEVLATGVTRIAVTSAVTGAEDVADACRRLRAALGA